MKILAGMVIMARPNKNTVEYFPHQCKHGQTMYVIDQRYANNGYSFWFKLLEILGDTPGHFIDCKSLNAWNYLLSYTHFTHNDGIEILNLLADQDSIDKELWGVNIIWSQNFIDGIADVYKRRKIMIPQKPQITIMLSSHKLLQQKNDNNPPIARVNVDNNPPLSLVNVDNNPPIAGVNAEETPQSKVKESKVNSLSTKGAICSTQNTDSSFSSFQNALRNGGNKVSVLVMAFKNWHKDAPQEDFDHDLLYGYIGKMAKRLNGDYGYFLKILWDTVTCSISGSHLNYINAMISSQLKKQSKDNVSKKIKEATPMKYKSPEEIDEEYLARQANG